jgi:hypothetical protein
MCVYLTPRPLCSTHPAISQALPNIAIFHAILLQLCTAHIARISLHVMYQASDLFPKVSFDTTSLDWNGKIQKGPRKALYKHGSKAEPLVPQGLDTAPRCWENNEAVFRQHEPLALVRSAMHRDRIAA